MPKIVNYNAFDIQNMLRTMTSKQIADFYGISYKALNCWCCRHKVSLLRLTDYELKEEIANKTVKEIAFEYNIGTSAVYYKLKKLGISPKTSLSR